MQNNPAENMLFKRAVKPDAHTVGTKTGAVIDTRGWRKCSFFLDLGTYGTSAQIIVKSGTTSGTQSTTIATGTAHAADDSSSVVTVNCEKNARYLRADLVAGGTEDAAIFCVLSDPITPPATQTATETINA